MKKLSDSEVKELFDNLKALMFWKHPPEYDTVKAQFNIRENEFYHKYKEMPESELQEMAKRLSSVLEQFPLSIYIETTNVCNLKCTMCPHEEQARKLGTMSLGLFEKIVNEIGQKQPNITVSPFYFGEPLADKYFFEKVALCKKAGLNFLKISTNGTLLSIKNNYKKVIDSGINHIIVSYDSLEKDVYESIRVGAKFESFMKGVTLMLDYWKQTGSKTQITAQMINMPTNSPGRIEFEKYTKANGLRYAFVPFQFWGKPVDGMTPSAELNEIRYACNNPFYSTVIHWNGDISACCMDSDGEMIFGNLEQDSIENIWKTSLAHFRQTQLDHDWSYRKKCETCPDFMTFGYNRYADLIHNKSKNPAQKEK